MITKAQKVAYVKKEGQTRDHHCHFPGCDKPVPPAMWGCKAHWMLLPKELRDRIWCAFNPGQEKNWTPSSKYLGVAHQVQVWCNNYLRLDCINQALSGGNYRRTGDHVWIRGEHKISWMPKKEVLVHTGGGVGKFEMDCKGLEAGDHLFLAISDIFLPNLACAEEE